MVSSGSPTEEGTYIDARAAYDWLVTRGVAPARIVLFGESLGCAVSLQLALDRRVGGVVLEAPFPVRAMAKQLFPGCPSVRCCARTTTITARSPG